MDHTREFIRTFERFSGRFDRHRVFLDWLTVTSTAFLAASSPWHKEEAQKLHDETAANYTPEERSEFARLLTITSEALEMQYQDFLGDAFMKMELGNKFQGQFFTPYHLSLAVAQLSIQDPDPEQDLITVQEPACGSAGMVIAAMEVFRSKGINFQTHTFTVATDVSEMAARMAYIQLTIIGCPAQVILGNSLSLEVRACWPTFFMGRVAHKLARRRDQAKEPAPDVPEPPPAPNERPPFPEQLSLF